MTESHTIQAHAIFTYDQEYKIKYSLYSKLIVKTLYKFTCICTRKHFQIHVYVDKVEAINLERRE
jgi:hypothetical protein